MEVGFSADNTISTGNKIDSKKVTIDLTNEDSKVNFTGASVNYWKKGPSDNSRGDILKQKSINFSELNHKTTFKVDKDKSTNDDFSIDGVMDPTLTLVRGKTYTFDMINKDAHPFYIKSKSNSNGTNDEYKIGITRVGSSDSSKKDDQLVFKVPYSAPEILWYQCSSHPSMLGKLKIVNDTIQSDESGVIDLTNLKEGDYQAGYKSDGSISSNAKINSAN